MVGKSFRNKGIIHVRRMRPQSRHSVKIRSLGPVDVIPSEAVHGDQEHLAGILSRTDDGEQAQQAQEEGGQLVSGRHSVVNQFDIEADNIRSCLINCSNRRERERERDVHVKTVPYFANSGP